MDNLIDQLDKINQLSEYLLTEKDTDDFNNQIADSIYKINIIVQDIKQILSNYKIPNCHIQAIDECKRKQKIIWKLLFTQYWKINSEVESLEKTELDALEATLNN